MSSEDSDYRIALAGSLPAEQANGWDDPDLAEDLFQNRAKVRYARIAYTVLHYREVTATGKRIITIALNRIEPVPDEHAAAEAREINTLYEARTGQATLFTQADEAEEAEAAEAWGDAPIVHQDPTAGPWPGDPEWKAPE